MKSLLKLIQMKKSKQIWIIGSVVLAVCVAVVFMLQLLNKEQTYRVIKLIETNGKISIIRADLGEVEVYENMRLQDNDKIIVGKDSNAYLSLGEDKYLYIEENSEVSLVSTDDSTGSIKIQLDKGNIINEIQKPLSNQATYTVATPNSTMSVRGTVFEVGVNFDQNNESFTKLSVFDGKVASQLITTDGNLSDELIVDTNYEVMIHGDDAINEYVVHVNEFGDEELLAPIDYQQLSADSMKVLLTIMEHGQLPDIELTQEELSELVELKEAQEEKIAELETVRVSYFDKNQNLLEIKEYDVNTFISLTVKEVEGYEFVGWFLDPQFTHPIHKAFFIQEDVTVYPKYIENLDTTYMVELYHQQQNGLYTLVDTQILNGTIGETITVDTQIIEGFTLNRNRSILTMKLNKENNIFKVYYDLPKVTYTVDSIEYEGVYGQTVTLKQGTKLGYHFVSFNSLPNGTGQTYGNTIVLKESFSAYSIFEPNTDIHYRVNVYLENLNGSYDYSETNIYQGVADSTLEFTPENIYGFTPEQNTYSVLINPNGTTQVDVRYRRDNIEYIIDDHTYSAKYGTQITLDTKSKVGYNFKGYFNQKNGQGKQYSEQFKLEHTFKAYSYFEARDDISFTVNIYHQNLQDDEFNLHETILLKGLADSSQSYKYPIYTGFTTNVASSNIFYQPNGQGKLDIYYYRNTIEYFIDNHTFSAKYGTKIQLSDLEKVGYHFAGYFSQPNGVGTKFLPEFTLEESFSAYSYFEPRHDIQFTVNIYKENIDDDLYTLDHSSSFIGTANDTIEYKHPDFYGFDIDGESTPITFVPDGSGKLNLYYRRNLISYSIDGQEYQDKYESIITLDIPTKQGYTFVGFNTQPDGNGLVIDNPFVLTEKLDIYAIFSNKNVNYKIIYAYENLENDEFTRIEQVEQALANSIVEIIPEEKQGFVTAKPLEVHIQSDGTTVVYVVYNRKRVTYSLDGGDIQTVKYGTTVSVDNVKDDKLFIGVYETLGENKVEYSNSSTFEIIKDCHLFTEYKRKYIIKVNHPNGNVLETESFNPLFIYDYLIGGYTVKEIENNEDLNDGLVYYELMYSPITIRIHMYNQQTNSYDAFKDFNGADITNNASFNLDADLLINFLSNQGITYDHYYLDQNCEKLLDNTFIFANEGEIINFYTPKEVLN